MPTQALNISVGSNVLNISLGQGSLGGVSGSISYKQDVFTVANPATLSYSTSQSIKPNSERVSINGVMLTNGIDYNVVNFNTITFTGYTLHTNDEVTAHYAY